MKTIQLFILSIIFCAEAMGQMPYPQDTIQTEMGEIIITLLGHGTLYFIFDSKVIHIDPVDKYADYALLPKADLIFITHQHSDHFQENTIDELLKDEGEVILTSKCAEEYTGEGLVAKNGDFLDLLGIKIEVVPAYNLVHKRDDGNLFHPKGEGNGYVFTLGNTRIYIAGDTENFPEMVDLKSIDIAFLPMNLPYTMTPEMVVESVKLFKPKVLYPYHYGNSNIDDLKKLMENINYCELRVRDMK